MKKYKIGFGMIVISMLAACSTSPEKRADDQLTKEVNAQGAADSPKQIMQRAETAFSNAPGLSVEQKIRLGEIYRNVYAKSMYIRRDIGQSKSLMFSRLASVDYDSVEMKKLKDRIVKLDQERLNIMFQALADVQAIVGRGFDKEKVYKYFQENELPKNFRDRYDE